MISYNPETCVLTFRRQPGFLTIYPEQVMITQVKDTDEGLELLAALKEAINTVWEQRDQLTPITDPPYLSPPAGYLEAIAPDQLWGMRRSNLHGVCLFTDPGEKDSRRMPDHAAAIQPSPTGE